MLVGVITSGVFSCSAPKKSNVYFQNLQKDTVLKNLVNKNFESKIQKNDFLTIAVASLSPDVAIYNASQNSASPTSPASSKSAVPSDAGAAYSVDSNGNILFIKLGTVHVAGMTLKELKLQLEKDLVPYLKEAIVSVSFSNRHVTMLGGIAPQVLPLQGDNMTILDALASTGDIVEKGKADNVLVIRENGENAKIFKRLDLTNSSVFYSPYYYLQPDDIIYVEPAKMKQEVPFTQILSYIISGVSLIFLIINSITK